MKVEVKMYGGLEGARKHCLEEIDRMSLTARQKVITMLPGQDEIYRAKRQEAERILAGESVSDFGWLPAEARATGQSLDALAAKVIDRALESEQRLIDIEVVRMQSKDAIKKHSEIWQMYETVEQARRKLDEING